MLRGRLRRLGGFIDVALGGGATKTQVRVGEQLTSNPHPHFVLRLGLRNGNRSQVFICPGSYMYSEPEASGLIDIASATTLKSSCNMFPKMSRKTIAHLFLIPLARAQESLYPPNFNASAELFVHLPNTNVTLCYQTIGNPSGPAIFLIPGLASSMMAFSPQFIHLLSPPSDPHYIIRFDPRDTGRSTAFPLGNLTAPPPYLLADLIQDVVGLLDHLSRPIHLVGFSAGGPLAFEAAAQRPNQVKSLFLGLTSPVGLQPAPEDNLPPTQPISEELVAKLGPLPALTDPKETWVEYLLRN